ncbi:flippase-like domain-containing protein [Candidatus Saccharibacteria bacterium]|nr:flippase-like domain-containing protein [Candidatus Saccharibacteria bacterium]
MAEKQSEPKQPEPDIDDKKLIPKKMMKKPLLIVVFVLINIIVIAATAFSEFGNSQNAAELSEVKINWWFLLPPIICFALAMVAEISKYVLIMRSMTKKDFNVKRAHKVARRTYFLGRYYDSITPAAIGGQPFQIYYMRKNSQLPDGESTAIPVFTMIAGQIGFIIIAIICFLFGSASINNAVLIGTACFGLLFYAFWPVTVMIATFLPQATAELINIIVRFLAKIHIVKNQKKTTKKVEYEINEYAKCVRLILKTRGLFIKTVALSVTFHILVSMIPFFVLTAFGGNVDFLPCFVTTVAVTSAVYFIPTPGNAGAAEGTFYVVFSALSSGYIFWAMLVWRFFSYYIYIIMGLVTYGIMNLERRKERKIETQKVPAKK